MPEGKKTNSDNDKLMGILAYLGILVLVPIFAGGKSKFVKFHANQGLSLLGLEIVLWILSFFIIPAILVGGLGILSMIIWVLQIGVLVLAILGIINVVNGEEKPLPIIGGITLLK